MAIDWHPRGNVRRTGWTVSNGRWGEIYGRIDLIDVHRNMLWTSVYTATYLRPGIARELGEFPDGDAAAVALWDEFMVEVRKGRDG